MKKLLIGLLALASVSAFACEVVFNESLTEYQLSELHRNNVQIVKVATSKNHLTLKSSTNLNVFKASDGYSLCQFRFCGQINASATVSVYKGNESGVEFLDSAESFSKTRTHLIPIKSHKAHVKLANLHAKVVDKAIKEVISSCKGL